MNIHINPPFPAKNNDIESSCSFTASSRLSKQKSIRNSFVSLERLGSLPGFFRTWTQTLSWLEFPCGLITRDLLAWCFRAGQFLLCLFDSFCTCMNKKTSNSSIIRPDHEFKWITAKDNDGTKTSLIRSNHSQFICMVSFAQCEKIRKYPWIAHTKHHLEYLEHHYRIPHFDSI